MQIWTRYLRTILKTRNTCMMLIRRSCTKPYWIHYLSVYVHSSLSTMFEVNLLSIQIAYQHVLFISFLCFGNFQQKMTAFKRLSTVTLDISDSVSHILSSDKIFLRNRVCLCNKIGCFTEIDFVWEKNTPHSTVLQRLFLPTKKWHTHSAFRSYHNLLIKHMSIYTIFFFPSF